MKVLKKYQQGGEMAGGPGGPGGPPPGVDIAIGILQELVQTLDTWETKEYASDEARWQEYAEDIKATVEKFGSALQQMMGGGGEGPGGPGPGGPAPGPGGPGPGGPGM